MKITKENFYECIENTKTKKTIQYKNLAFIITKNRENTNFKLKPNSKIYLGTLTTIIILSLLFTTLFIIEDNEYLVRFGIIPMMGMIYFSKKISLLLTEKIFKNQIIEFYNILKQYNKEKISKLNETN